MNYCLKTGAKLFSLNTLKHVSSRAQRTCGSHLSIYGMFTESCLRYAHNNRARLKITAKISWSINIIGNTLFGPFMARDRTEIYFVTRKGRLRVVSNFPSGMVDRAKRERA